VLHGLPLSRTRTSELESGLVLRIGPVRHRRLKARLMGVVGVAIWSACLLGVAAIAGLALAGLQSGV
jgi:hypothetical protein